MPWRRVIKLSKIILDFSFPFLLASTNRKRNNDAFKFILRDYAVVCSDVYSWKIYTFVDPKLFLIILIPLMGTIEKILKRKKREKRKEEAVWKK